ncbi:MAG: two component transcriptional regulator LuxR family [Chitinophagaceae bacterium]|nr:MAG: two component transcriptional regulator LuxR family [Chitinophagaceae bacterium]
MVDVSVMMCDDHVQIRDSILQTLEQEFSFKICGRASSGKECIELISSGIKPTILILDISMPNGMHGYDVAKFLQKNYPAIKILVFSSFDDRAAIKAMIRFGAKGFVCKGGQTDELKRALLEVTNGGTYFPKDFIITAKEIKEIQSKPIEWAENMTQKEWDLAHLITSDLPLKQVAAKLDISESVASKRRKSVFKKTGAKSSIGLIAFLKKIGIM